MMFLYTQMFMGKISGFATFFPIIIKVENYPDYLKETNLGGTHFVFSTSPGSGKWMKSALWR